jgi:glutamate carboxypeptidase
MGLPRPASAAVGGASDGNFTAGVGTPTLDGLGAVGGGAHAEDEHVVVDELPARTALLRALVEELLADSTKPFATSGAARP